MTSKFLENMGLGGLDIGIVLLVLIAILFILLVMCIVTSVELCKLKKRYLKFSGGKDAKSLEKEIGDVFQQNKILLEQTEKNRKELRVLYRRFETAFQKVGLIKYDAFSQMGGQLSFCLALLDENNNGFVINSVNGTDACYTYAKEIVRGECKIELGTEEENALKMAMHE